MNMSAFNTKANNPKVMRVIGSVSTNKIGRTTRLSNPSMTAATIAIVKLETSIPGMR